MNTSEIAIVLPHRESFNPSACGAVALCMKEYISESELKNKICVYGGSSDEGFPEINYQKVFIKKTWLKNKTSQYTDQLISDFSKNHCKVILINNRPEMAIRLIRKQNKPIILYFHNDSRNMSGSRNISERKWLMKHCAAIVCVSQYIKNQFLQGFDTVQDKIHVIHPGVKIPKIDLSNKEKIILYSGRIVEEKGPLILVQALRQVLPELPAWRAIMVGARRQDSDDLSSYEKRVTETLGPIQNKVDYLGFRSHSEVMNLFEKAAIAVVPSIWQEPFGRTALEALASGCALISSERGGLKEISSGHGRLCLDITPESLAKELKYLIKDPEELSKYQSNGRKQAEKFSLQQTAIRLDDLLTSFI